MVSYYSQQLKDLFNKGDNLLMNFETKNALLLEKLDYLILKFQEDNLEQHDKVESLRNKLVGESHLYKGFFRKKRVANQHLLSCLFVYLEYGYLKPGMIMGDCSKKELQKFLADSKIWLQKCLTEEDKK